MYPNSMSLSIEIFDKIELNKVTVLTGLSPCYTELESFITKTGHKNCRLEFFPENYLHPRHQIKHLRKIISERNIYDKTIIVTNSDYIIRELNTLIGLFARKDEEFFKNMIIDDSKKEDYSYFKIYKSMLIDYKDVTAYDFIDDIEGKKLEIDKICGIGVKSMDDIIVQMNQLQTEIYYRDLESGE